MVSSGGRRDMWSRGKWIRDYARFLDVLEAGGSVWETVQKDAMRSVRTLELVDAGGVVVPTQYTVESHTLSAVQSGRVLRLRKDTRFRGQACRWRKFVWNPNAAPTDRKEVWRKGQAKRSLDKIKARKASSIPTEPMRYAYQTVCSDCPFLVGQENPDRFGHLFWESATTKHGGKIACVKSHAKEPQACAGWLLGEGQRHPEIVQAQVRGLIDLKRVEKINAEKLRRLRKTVLDARKASESAI